jgi:hypothetical protein
MASTWDRAWLYMRLTLMVLLIVFVVQLFLINIQTRGVMLIGTATVHNVYLLLLTFFLGMLAAPLCRASIRTWKEYRAERARQREQLAEQAVQKTLGDILHATEGKGAVSREAGGGAADPKPAPERKTPNADAADVWTSGEEPS